MERVGMERVLARILAVLGAASCGGNVGGDDGDPSGAGDGGTGGMTSHATGGASGSGTGGRAPQATGGTGGFVATGGFVSSTGGAPGMSGAPGTGGAPPDYRGDEVGRIEQPDPAVFDELCESPFEEYEIYARAIVCFRPPESGASCAEHYAPEGVANSFGCGLSSAADVVCGPALLPFIGNVPEGSCCYALGSSCPVGRPFIVDGVARTARPAGGIDWLSALSPRVLELDPETRRALADAYTQDGLTEHASVASFARFTLHLLALGAPADLVAAAQKAGLEEVDHARASFGLASAYAGVAVGPAALEIAGALDGPNDLVALAVSVASEGCIAETVSAALIAAARDAATDPIVRDVLSRVCEQELDHALLAWRTLSWALQCGGARVREAVSRIFAEPERHVGFGAVTSHGGCGESLRAHGYLPLAERRAVAATAIRSVVNPAARALLSRDTASLARHRECASV